MFANTPKTSKEKQTKTNKQTNNNTKKTKKQQHKNKKQTNAKTKTLKYIKT